MRHAATPAANHVYLAGFGLASSMGVNLTAALRQLHQAPAPQRRTIQGLDVAIPYFAISDDTTGYSIGQSPETWYARCARLIRQVAAEAGSTGKSSKSSALYLASASVNVGAIEAGEPHATTLPAFLAELAQMLDWEGPVHWINTACTSSLNAMLAAQDAIQSGCIAEALIIGLELENKLTLAGFAGMQLLSTNKGKPFAADRDGLVLGEAVAVLRLSSLPSRWRIAGGAQVIDSSLASGASTSAYLSMLEQTLAHAQLSAAQIDLVKVQAAGSIPNDAVEAQALCDFFAPLPPLLSIKPLIGHTLGASGAAEIALLFAILEHGLWPNLNGQTVDPALGVQLAVEAPQRIKHILACILGFGGSHSCIALEDTSA